MIPLADCRLYAFVDTSRLRGRKVEALTDQLCEGGADLIQLRAKDLPIDQIRRFAGVMLGITRASGVNLVINDHPLLARELGAECCHLGQEDFFDAHHEKVSEVRGDSPLLVGLSTHSPEQADRAVRAGADYVAVGPIYPTPTKPGVPAVTLEYVRWARKHLTIPWFAIGGITLETLDAVLEAGATRICVVSAILDAPDVATACRTFKNRLCRSAE